MTSIDTLTKRIEAIEKRNIKVESDKAWETSSARKFIVLILTYFVIGLYLHSTGVNSPWRNAFVPAIGFFLSTLTLNALKNLWIKYSWKK